MGASSVTGTGPGMSEGKKKPGNSCGCSCGGKPEEVVETTPIKRGCVTNYKTGNKTSYKTSNGIAKTKVC